MTSRELGLKHCAECASFCAGMAKLKKSEGNQAEAELWTGHGEHHVAMYKALEGTDTEVDTNDDSRGTDLKAASNLFGMPAARDFAKAAPSLARGVLPDAPAARLVARPGSAPFQKEKIEADTEAIDALMK